MWLPDWLYEALPRIYAILGLVVVYNFETPLGYTSGVILLFTSCIIWFMRRDYRQANTHKKTGKQRQRV